MDLETETVRLANGEAAQALVPGVAPVAQVARDLAALELQRHRSRGAGPLPSGGLFDECARAQQDLFAT